MPRAYGAIETVWTRLIAPDQDCDDCHGRARGMLIYDADSLQARHASGVSRRPKGSNVHSTMDDPRRLGSTQPE